MRNTNTNARKKKDVKKKNMKKSTNVCGAKTAKGQRAAEYEAQIVAETSSSSWCCCYVVERSVDDDECCYCVIMT